ncbi:MAG: pyridoxamine 5'-phosphate oxidase family protein [Proteobacteria bacterium]|nr:pyridoxamine 5'-phosphate oxidase family protein [Pseudomonadota bacterium]MBU1419881.1 pyridoxamine 5'-phosphate oxidase family protein [Pseudomonadota bacterium]
MRRKQCEITEYKHICRVLTGCTVGRLATSGADGYPYITPVNFVWWQDAIYFHSAPEGEKLENMKRDAKVCFEVDIPLSYLGLGCTTQANPCRLHQLYHCVIIRGLAALLEDGEEKAGALNALVRAHEPEADFPPLTAKTPALSACAVVKIHPLYISAKSDLLQGKDAETINGISEYLLHRGQETDIQTVQAIKTSQRKGNSGEGDR